MWPQKSMAFFAKPTCPSMPSSSSSSWIGGMARRRSTWKRRSSSRLHEQSNTNPPPINNASNHPSSVSHYSSCCMSNNTATSMSSSSRNSVNRESLLGWKSTFQHRRASSSPSSFLRPRKSSNNKPTVAFQTKKMSVDIKSRKTAMRQHYTTNANTTTKTTTENSSSLDGLVRTHGSISEWASGLSSAQRDQVLQALRRSGRSSAELAMLEGEGIESSACSSEAAAATVPEPTRRELQMVATNQAIPFVGFGIMDNSILILAGDAIDTSLGVTLGISTLCAAAIGNIVADVAGLMFGTVIEDYCANTLRLPVPNLSTAQRQLRSVRFASQGGCTIGVIVGCIIGMFPLLFIDSSKIQARKREAHLDSMFRDVVTEAGSLVGAARTCLYVLVSPEEDDSSSKDGASRPKTVESLSVPDPNGKFLFNKYDVKPSGSVGANTIRERWIPLGRGIISRAILTGESWNITDVTTEPDFVPEIGCVEPGVAAQSQDTRNMICVPVMDSNGRPIAVIQAINKIRKGRDDDKSGSLVAAAASLELQCFTENDVQILKALASHISVTLQRMYEHVDDENAETRLTDTIRMLKKYGLSGLEDDEGVGNTRKKLERRPLFPDD